MDDVQCLPAITDSLVARTQASAEGGTRTLTVNGREIRWFEFVSPLFPEQRELIAGAWVLANYPTYLGERYPNLRPEQEGTTREKALQFSNQPERMLKDVTGFTLVLGPNEIERLIQELEAFGYKIRSDATKRIAQEPEIEFVLIPAAGKQPHSIDIEMALTQSKSGKKDYRARSAGSRQVGAEREPVMVDSPQPREATSWDVLRNAVFVFPLRVGPRFGERSLLGHKAPVASGVYAFVVDDCIAYVGVTTNGLRTRLGQYCRVTKNNALAPGFTN
jgi:hypothetical protein